MLSALLNPKTKINIKPYLKRYKKENNFRKMDWNYFFRIFTQRPFTTKAGKVSELQFFLTEDKTVTFGAMAKNTMGKEEIKLHPTTHMYDFEVNIDDEGREKIVAKGQGICIIFFEEFNQYFKFVYDDEKDTGVNVVDNSNCLSATSLEMYMSQNLSSGWSFFYVKEDGKVDHLCEEEDERDRYGSIVLLKDLFKNDERKKKKPKVVKEDVYSSEDDEDFEGSDDSSSEGSFVSSSSSEEGEEVSDLSTDEGEEVSEKSYESE